MSLSLNLCICNESGAIRMRNDYNRCPWRIVRGDSLLTV